MTRELLSKTVIPISTSSQTSTISTFLIILEITSVRPQIGSATSNFPMDYQVDYLEILSTERRPWRIQVRVVHRRKQPTYTNDSDLGDCLEMVVVDQWVKNSNFKVFFKVQCLNSIFRVRKWTLICKTFAVINWLLSEFHILFYIGYGGCNDIWVYVCGFCKHKTFYFVVVVINLL